MYDPQDKEGPWPLKFEKEIDPAQTWKSIVFGHVNATNALLARKDIQINQGNQNGATPLYIACQKGHLKVVQSLLTHKEIDINKDCKGTTPLAKAMEKEHNEIVTLLQHHGSLKCN